MSYRYSQLANAMEHSCSCCKETRSTVRSIDLHCLNGDVIRHNYVYVEQCGCDRTECSQAASKARKRRSYWLVWWACEHVNTFSFWRFHNLHLNLAIIISSNKNMHFTSPLWSFTELHYFYFGQIISKVEMKEELLHGSTQLWAAFAGMQHLHTGILTQGGGLIGGALQDVLIC